MSQSGWSEIAAAGFRARLPWLGGDLQTLRDTLKPPRLPVDLGEHVRVPMACGGQLLAVHDHCPDAQALVLLLHGLGGHSDREGLRAKPMRLRPCLLYTSPSPRDMRRSRMPSSA